MFNILSVTMEKSKKKHIYFSPKVEMEARQIVLIMTYAMCNIKY